MKIVLNNTKRGKDYRETSSLDGAVTFLKAYIEHLNLRSSEMDLGFGEVYVHGKLVYEISYNGKISIAKDPLQKLVAEKIEKIKNGK